MLQRHESLFNVLVIINIIHNIMLFAIQYMPQTASDSYSNSARYLAYLVALSVFIEIDTVLNVIVIIIN